MIRNNIHYNWFVLHTKSNTVKIYAFSETLTHAYASDAFDDLIVKRIPNVDCATHRLKIPQNIINATPPSVSHCIELIAIYSSIHKRIQWIRLHHLNQTATYKYAAISFVKTQEPWIPNRQPSQMPWSLIRKRSAWFYSQIYCRF